MATQLSGSETRPVEFVLTLPADLATDVEHVHRSDPDFLGRVIQYALARRIIFEELAADVNAEAV